MRVPFVKMDGAGNDYVLVDAIRDPFPLQRGAELARTWSDRRFGIGADGLIVMLRGVESSVAMAMWNADGSEGAMCGNGIRCLAVLAREHGHVDSDTFWIETKAGPRSVRIERDAHGATASVVVDMGSVTMAQKPTVVEAGGRLLEFWISDVGNPHATVFVDDMLQDFPVETIGANLQHSPWFPEGVNVEFVRVEPDGSLRQRTYERGSGETLACGTGACASAHCALQLGLVKGPAVVVRLRGGDLRVVQHDASLVLQGPARTVYSGFVEVREHS